MKIRPHPLGNEYHTTEYWETKISWIELVEGKDNPTEGPYAEFKF